MPSPRLIYCSSSCKKPNEDYSTTTRYLDYAISEHLFHLESQAKDTVASGRDQNYLHHEKQNRSIAVFTRFAKMQAMAERYRMFAQARPAMSSISQSGRTR